MNAINNSQKQPNPILESARRDSLREDGPAQVNFSIFPSSRVFLGDVSQPKNIVRKTTGEKRE